MATEPIVNIGPRQCQRRMLSGILFVAFGVALAAALLSTDAGWLTRVFCFVPFWIGALGVAQARQKTCVALVAVGQRNLDAGNEPVPPEQRAALRAQAVTVYLKATLAAAALTGLALILP